MKKKLKHLAQHRLAKRLVLISILSALLLSLAFLALSGRTPVLAQVNLPWNYTTVADFSGCQSVASNVTITNNSGGEIGLTSTDSPGSFTSCIIDAGGQTVWGTLVANAFLPAGTSVVYETRTSFDGTNWSVWATVDSSGAIAGFQQGRRYIQYRVTLDSGGASLPEVRQIVLTPANSARDTTVSDFNGCGVFTNTSVSNMDGGELRLEPIFEDYFDGTQLNYTDWFTRIPNPSVGSINISDGLVTLDGAQIRSNISITSTDLPLAVEGRLRLAQPISGSGFGDFGLGKFTQAPGPPNILFITNGTSQVSDVETSANDYAPGASGPQRTEIVGYDWTQYHDFRFWTNNSQVIYYIDNTSVVTHSLSQPMTMPLHLWLVTLNQNRDLVADWVRVARYQSSGEYVSCVIDMSRTADWNTLTWLGTTPAGTSVTFATRSSSNGITWSDWDTVGPDTIIGSLAGRYLQYRATLTTGDLTLSPTIDEVNILANGYQPPLINNLFGLALSPTDAQITWNTDQLAKNRLDYGLTPALGTGVTNNEYAKSHQVNLTGLQAQTVYYYRTTVTNTLGQVTQSSILSFTMPLSIINQTTAAQFGQGSSCNVLSGTIVSDVSGGEVRLRSPSQEDYFISSPLDTGQWRGVFPENGQTYNPTINNGIMSVSGPLTPTPLTARVRSKSVGPAEDDPTYDPPQIVEFRARFAEGNRYQHIGFSSFQFGQQWAVFSTGPGGVGAEFIAWSSYNSDDGEQITPLPNLNLNIFHDFRIVWTATEIQFYVDGVQVDTHYYTASDVSPVNGPLWLHMSNGAGNDDPLEVDWIRMTNYPGSGTFRSCTLDAGSVVKWNTLAWLGQRPAGTDITMRTRTSTDGINWSPWSASMSGQSNLINNPAGRYLQYEATLTTANSNSTPVLELVTASYNPVAYNLQLDVNAANLIADNITTATITATITDQGGQPALDGQAVRFTTTLGQLPTMPVYTATVAGGQGQATATIKSALTGNGQLGATMVTYLLVSDTLAIVYQPGPLGSFELSNYPSAVLIGQNLNMTVTAYDTQHNIKTNYSGIVDFSSGDTTATLPNDNGTGWVSGVNTFTLAFNTAGTWPVVVQDQTLPISKTALIGVNLGPLDSFEFSTYPGSIAAGQPFSITVSAFDINDYLKTDYTGTVNFSSSDAAATLPGDNGAGWVSGSKSFTVVLKTTGSRSIVVQDGTVAVSQTTAITVQPGALGSFELSDYPTTTISNEPFSLTVTAYDAYGNLKTDYSGPVSFSSNDGAANLPTDNGSGWVNGAKMFTVTLNTPGSRNVIVTAGAISQTAPIEVLPGPLASFDLSDYPTSTLVGQSFPVTVTAYDGQGHVKTNYAGLVTFSSTDTAAALPTDDGSGWVNGVKTFNVTLNTAGTWDVTVQNQDASVSQTFSITVEEDGFSVFVPVVIR